MLKGLHLCWKHACRVKRYQRLVFQPGLNVLIGPNGSGKSTILQAILTCPECRRTEEGHTDYLAFNTHRHDPSRPDHRVVRYTDMVVETRAKFSSHGQMLQAAFAALPLSPATCLLLDEPEAGQDVDHRVALRKAMDRAVAGGAQLILSSHDPLFWRGAHVIELARGYTNRVIRAYRDHLPAAGAADSAS
jgi:predicted ATPase